MSTEDRINDLIHGERKEQYGPIAQNDDTVIELFFIRTGIRLPKGSYPIFMQCVKVMREFNKHSEDNLIDLGGYRKLEDEVDNQQDGKVDRSLGNIPVEATEA